MSEQAAPVSPPLPEKASGGCANGCLRGCAITLAVLAALLVLSVVWAVIWGRPLLAAHLPVWEAQYPLLTPLLDYTGLRSRLVPQSDIQELQQRRVDGQNDRGLVPLDIPIYEHPLEEAFSVSEAQVTGYQLVAGAVQDARARLLDGMGVQGWALVQERIIDEGVQLFWTKDMRTCEMDLFTSGGNTEVWLRSSESP